MAPKTRSRTRSKSKGRSVSQSPKRGRSTSVKGGKKTSKSKAGKTNATAGMGKATKKKQGLSRKQAWSTGKDGKITRGEVEFADGRPPLPLVGILVVVFGVCFWNIDHLAFPLDAGVYDTTAVDAMRALFLIFIVVVEGLEIAKNPIPSDVIYLAGSKLVTTQVDMSGFRQLGWFTHWSWCLLGFYFSSAIALGQHAPLSIILWEIAMPNAFLVTIVVTFVIWPGMLRKKQTSESIRTPCALAMHNANIAMCGMEMVFASTNAHLSHMAVAPLFGCIYVFFSWYHAPLWKPEAGPQYLYDFFDTTLPLKVVLKHYVGM